MPVDAEPGESVVPTLDLSWRPVQLAVVLARDGVRFVVVGGTARLLLGGDHPPADLDVVVRCPGQLLDALARLGAAPARVRRAPARINTCFGPVDVFVGQVATTTLVGVGGTVLTIDAAA